MRTERGRAIARRLVRAATVVPLVALGLAIAATPAAPASASTASTSSCSLAPHNTTVARSITVPGHIPSTRHYYLNVPSGLTGDSTLLLSLHGGAISAPYWESISKWTPESNDDKFIVAYPQGLLNLWNSGSPTSADIPFLRAVVADISATWCVDADRVYIEGGSMGGWMAQRMMCHSPDVFAAVASGGAGHAEVDLNGNEFVPPYDCTPARPASVYLSMGDQDNLALHADAFARWQGILGCPAAVPVPGGTYGVKAVAAPCNGGAELVYRTWTGIGHTFTPPPAMQEFAKDEVQAFFAAHPMP